MEKWLPAPGYETYLEVSNLGNVRSLDRRVETVSRWNLPMTLIRPGKPVSPWVGKNGYKHVSVKIKDKRPKATVHRLVAKAFVNGYEDGLTVNHINGDKLDNRAENLEWVSLSDNTKLEWSTGLVDLRGDRHPGRKLSAKQVRLIRKLLKQGISANALSVIADVSAAAIYLIRDGKRWASLDSPTLKASSQSA